LLVFQALTPLVVMPDMVPQIGGSVEGQNELLFGGFQAA
jgi:hypothetical protein